MKSKFTTRRILAIALTLLAISTTQDIFAQIGFSLGPKAGLSITTLKGDDLDDIKSQTNFLGGVFVNLQIAPAFALQPEFLISEKGAEITSNNVKGKVSINYFEIPILAKIRLPLANDVIFPHVLLGPNFGFKTDVDISGTDTQSGTAFQADADDVKNTDIGALVGAGIDIQTRGSGIFFTIDGRYGFGFSDINDNDEMIEVRNAGWNFAVGLGFRLGKKDDD